MFFTILEKSANIKLAVSNGGIIMEINEEIDGLIAKFEYEKAEEVLNYVLKEIIKNKSTIQN